jgi:hypothetical protein
MALIGLNDLPNTPTIPKHWATHCQGVNLPSPI